MKKVFNWFGLIVNFLYIAFIVVAKLLGDKMEISGNVQIRNIFYAIALIMTISAFAFIPAIWHKTLGVLLPTKSEKAIFISRHINKSNVVLEWNLVSFEHLYIIFELKSGLKKGFKLNNKNSCLYLPLFPCESGTLCYKEQGKHLYFVSFTPDREQQNNTGDGSMC